ncbi:phosphonate metabolism protein/1,5-bisphosphokinase (PRPP-forming) PhnN [Allorhizobium undicola]|uniref:phosphonate metabolism protein/1,5-bisphosphokinase (PRPP-forming) PhnN n=1 Tax=Allorhizobium undicola TaxID=78527 RepID=UPI00048A0451|nr:phosphonate metabolism protein/1,5-bisphosphokinase (PRPP-forming) PhnN [Allorhizobium undicola]
MGDNSSHPDQGAGCLLVVVGPSGAGKDSLIDFARNHFLHDRRVHFVRRFITRPAEAGGENHQPLCADQFDAMKAQGLFSVEWQAHGLRYAIPADVGGHVANGRIVVVNGSRSVLPLFARVFRAMTVVNVTARPEVLADRLEARGRESRGDILARLSRASLALHGNYHVVHIDNSGALEKAGGLLVEMIETLLSR